MSLFSKLLPQQKAPEFEPQIPLGQQVQEKQKQSSFFFCLNMQNYFDVQQHQVYERLKAAITLKPPFSQATNGKPDLYGPFWIASTLIVIIIASSFVMALYRGGKEEYQFSQVSVAAGLIYGICFGCPYIIALLVKCFGSTLSVVQLICVYGYSMTVFIPITAVCFINSYIVQIAILSIGYCFSTFFLIRGVLSMDRSMQQGQRMTIGAFIMGVQMVLVLMYKLYFFGIVK